MQSVLSTPTAKSFRWPVIVGLALTVGKSWLGDTPRIFGTVSPCGLTTGLGSGRSPFRPGYRMLQRAILFYPRDGTIYVKRYRDGRTASITLLSLRHTHIVASFRTCIALSCNKLPLGSRTWLITPVLAIRRKR